MPGNPVTVHAADDVFWNAMSAEVCPAPELPGTAVHAPCPSCAVVQAPTPGWSAEPERDGAVTACVLPGVGVDPAAEVSVAAGEGACVAEVAAPPDTPCAVPVPGEDVHAPVADAAAKTVRTSAAVRPVAVIRFMSRS
jgi:hypothetical protein